MERLGTIFMRLVELIFDHFILVGMMMAMLFVFSKIKYREKHFKEAKKKLKKAIDMQLAEPLTMHPEINPALCAGCGACTRVCPEGDIYKMINHQPQLVAPTKCVGHGACEAACPTQAITLVFGTKTRGMEIPKLSVNYETNVPGLYIAGELGGMGLIRNAVKQGVWTAQHALKQPSVPGTDCDILVIGAGPAGLAAGLVGIAEKKKYRVIEQGKFGGSVYNFPRQKVVMTHPTDFPIVGKKQFPNHKVSKEQLLEYWQEIISKTGLKIEEGVRFESMERKGNLFEVKTTKGLIKAGRVILAMGVRGSPRRLGVPGEGSTKVTYNLIDPEQYQEKHVVVVGGGNSGVEAAQMLGEGRWKNKTTLLVRGPNFDRCNEDNQKRIKAQEAKKEVEIWYNSSVSKIGEKDIEIMRDGKPVTIPNDYVFVFAGAETPFKFLMSLGINIEKKFGEGLGGKKADGAAKPKAS